MKAPGAVRFGLVLLGVGSLLNGGPSVQAAGWREVTDSWLFDGRTAAMVLGVTGDEWATPHWEIAIGQGRLFSLRELPQLEFSGQLQGSLGSRPWRLRGRWHQLGEAIFQEHRVRGEGVWGRSPGLGLGWETVRSRAEGQILEPVARVFLILEFVRQVAPSTSWWVRLDQAVDGPSPLEHRDRRTRFLVLGFQRGTAALALQWDRRPDGTPLLGGDLLWRGARGLGLSFRWDPASGALGPGLWVWRGALVVRTSHLVHPVLGPTHRFGLVIGGGRVP